MFTIFLKLKASPYTQSLPYASLYFSEIAKFGGGFLLEQQSEKEEAKLFPPPASVQFFRTPGFLWLVSQGEPPPVSSVVPDGSTLCRIPLWRSWPSPSRGVHARGICSPQSLAQPRGLTLM